VLGIFLGIFLLLFFSLHAAAFAQDGASDVTSVDTTTSEPPAETWKLPRGAKEMSFELGFAPMQPTFLSGREEYDTAGRKLLLGSFRWGRVIGTAKGVTFQYLFEAMPVATAIRNEVRNPAFTPDGMNGDEFATLRENTYGAAIHPAGFRFVFMPRRRVKPFVQTSAGFIFSRKPIPIPESPSYNFSGDFGGGVMYSIHRNRTINIGYRYFHISNMNIGEVNPGYNANVFYISYSSFYK
jgi:hypothetical protein